MKKDVNFFDNVISDLERNKELDDDVKSVVLKNIARLKERRVNILITGGTGCGKSSTINALFDSEKAKVGQGVDPETMDIVRYELDNIVLYDSPGLGDGKEADRRHSKNIIDKLYEKNKDGGLLIDLVLVILDGSSRDLGTSFELINNVIIPNLGEDKSRLLVAINQADMAMKGRGWDRERNRPNAELVKFLDAKVESTRRRIKEATGVDVEPVYYAAGYKDGDDAQRPFNLSKLLLYILRHAKEDKRAVFIQDMNKNSDMWKDDDGLVNYRDEVRKTFMESVVSSAAEGASLGGSIGKIFGGVGEAVGRAVGGVIGGLWGGIKSIFGW